eukprot:6199357-Pleurochrysis_carterae.AAC.3
MAHCVRLLPIAHEFFSLTRCVRQSVPLRVSPAMSACQASARASLGRADERPARCGQIAPRHQRASRGVCAAAGAQDLPRRRRRADRAARGHRLARGGDACLGPERAHRVACRAPLRLRVLRRAEPRRAAPAHRADAPAAEAHGQPRPPDCRRRQVLAAPHAGAHRARALPERRRPRAPTPPHRKGALALSRRARELQESVPATDEHTVRAGERIVEALRLLRCGMESR